MRLGLASIVFLLAAAASFGLLVRGVDALTAGEDPRLNLDAWSDLGPRIERLASDADGARDARLVLLGDSTTFVGAPLHLLLEGSLAPLVRTPEPKVELLAVSGLNPFDYYFLSAPVSRTHAGRVVMNLNLAAFSEPFRRYFSRPELAGWIPPRRWAEAATLPLHWQGVKFDELLLRSAIVGLGAVDVWQALSRQGARLSQAWELASRRAQGRDESFRGPFTTRMLWILAETGRIRPPGGAEALRARYGPALDGVPADHPVLRLTRAAVSAYVEAGIGVTVYASPLNVEALERAGLAPGPGLAASIARARDAVESAGGQFVDLHALLPDRSFRDPAGHLEPDGQRRLAGALARAIASGPRGSRPGVR